MVIAISGKKNYKTELIASGHSLIADESIEAGGGNLGPAPGELLQLSLASCTAITLRMFAARKNWPVEEIRVEVGSEKLNDTTIFQRDVYLTGPLSEEQKQRMLQIANSCPVHKTLTHPIEIKTQLS
jgi:putative redox protein